MAAEEVVNTRMERLKNLVAFMTEDEELKILKRPSLLLDEMSKKGF